MDDLPRTNDKIHASPSMRYTSTLPPEMQERLLTAQINKLHKQIASDLKESDELEQKVKSGIEELLGVDASLRLKCKRLKIQELFQSNTQNEASLQKLQTCFNIIAKCARNLLKKTKRPDNWRSIPLFPGSNLSQKVDTIQGSREIFAEIGYSNATAEGLVFIGEPDQDRVARYTVDLLLVECELETYMSRSHPHPHHIDQLLPLNLRLQQYDSSSSSLRREPIKSPGVQSHGEQSVLPLVPGMTGDGPPLGQKEAGEEDEFHDAVEFQTVEVCDICGDKPPVLHCPKCDDKLLCTECDNIWHNHRLRKGHSRESYQPRPVANKQQPQQGNQYGPGSSFNLDVRPKVPSKLSPSQTNSSVIQQTPGDNMPILSIFEHEESRVNTNDTFRKPSQDPAALNRRISGEIPRRVSSESEHSFTIGTPESLRSDHSSFGATGTLNRSASRLDEIKAIANKEERIQRIKQELGKMDNLLDQYKQEVNVIFRQDNDFESNPEFQRLSKERDRLNRDKILVEEHWKGLEKEKFENKQRSKRESSAAETLTPPAIKDADIEDVEIKFPPTKSRDTLYNFEQDDQLEAMMEKQKQTDSMYGSGATPKRAKIEPERSVGGDVKRKTMEPHAWVCDHCTYHNNMQDKSCSVCGKTSDKPSYVFHESVKESEIDILSQNPLAEKKKSMTLPKTLPPSASKMADRKSSTLERRSIFVEQQDEIFREKQLARERYQQLMREEGKGDTQQAVPVPSITVTRQTEPPKQPLKKAVHFHLRQTTVTKTDSEAFDVKTKLDEINREKEQHEATIQAKEVIRILRKAETEGYDVREVEVALVQTECIDIFQWLQTSWKQRIEDLCAQAQQSLRQHGDYQTHQGPLVSEKEAKSALIDCWGDTELALNKILMTREELVEELMETYHCSMGHVVELLQQNTFNKEAVEQQLRKELFEPFKLRLWPEEGIVDDLDNGLTPEKQKEARLRDTDIDQEARIRMVLCEYRDSLSNWARAENVVRVLEQVDRSICLADVVEAVRQCGDRGRTLKFLQQECEICFSTFPSNMILSVTQCQCKVCRDCMNGYFENQIKERHIKNLCCPVCEQPDVETNDIYLTYLDNFLRNLISQDAYDLFQNKVRDWHLQKDPNFRWCSTENCENGFIFNGAGNALKMLCSKCKKFTCFKCKKPWEDQHQGITCEEFRQWKEENNPEFQEAGLAKHLQENGIDCPQCKMRYSLAKGGCMHFKCTQCGHEFCCGCNQPFMQGRACQQLESCKRAGLHCHHPRDCLYYLRDHDIDYLQDLLKDNDVEFQQGNQQDNDHCIVLEQKEQQAGLIDEACGKPVVQAGLCQLHYKEYLVSKINRNGIDPVTKMTEDKLRNEFMKRESEPPAREQGEGETQYRQKLINAVRQRFPLERREQILY